MALSAVSPAVQKIIDEAAEAAVKAVLARKSDSPVVELRKAARTETVEHLVAKRFRPEVVETLDGTVDEAVAKRLPDDFRKRERSEHVAKLIDEAVRKYEREHPGCRKTDAIDAATMDPTVVKLVRMESAHAVMTDVVTKMEADNRQDRARQEFKALVDSTVRDPENYLMTREQCETIAKRSPEGARLQSIIFSGLAKGDPQKWQDKFNELVADHLKDNPGTTKSDAILAVAATDKGKKCLANDKALRLGMPVDDSEDDDGRVDIDKQQVPHLRGSPPVPPSQRADEQEFDVAPVAGGGRVDPAIITASDKEILGRITDAQTRAIVLGIRRKMNCSVAEAVKEAERLGIKVTDLGAFAGGARASAAFPGADSGPLGKLQSMAVALRKSDPTLSQAQAFTKVYMDPANRGLVEQERTGRLGQ